jgi:hypothetical protein
MSEAANQAKYQDLKRVRLISGLIAASILVIDFLMASPTLTLFLALYVFFVLLPVTVFSFKNKPRMRYTGTKLVIYGCLLAWSYGFYTYDLALARRRAETVITAVDQFHHDQGRYPATLEELVPAYLGAIPRPRLVPGAFRYSQSPGDPYLMYSGLGMFDRYSWSFTNQEWYYLD